MPELFNIVVSKWVGCEEMVGQYFYLPHPKKFHDFREEKADGWKGDKVETAEMIQWLNRFYTAPGSIQFTMQPVEEPQEQEYKQITSWLLSDSPKTLQLAQGFSVLCVRYHSSQHGKGAAIWFLESCSEAKTIEATFVLLHTGELCPSTASYVGTAEFPNGHIAHVFMLAAEKQPTKILD